MKTCPVCANNVEDTYLFCPDDGSSLSATGGTSGDESQSLSQPDTETDGAVVLYCPACAAEYPLTFSECPTHGVKLTKHNLHRLTNRASVAVAEPAAAEPATVAPDVKQPAITTPDQPDPLESRQRTTAAEPVAEGAIPASAARFDYRDRPSLPLDQELDVDSGNAERIPEFGEQGLDRPGFRVAAIATAIALSLFALAGIYGVLSSVSRRPSAPVMQITEASPQPFVPTPQEAQDYKEEQPAPAAPTVKEPEPDRTADRNSDAHSTAERSARIKTAEQSTTKTPVESRSDAASPLTKASSPPMPAVPRGNSGGFDARLIRVRSNKTSSGVRYDLTFNMQEQAGRSAQWQRVLVTTRSLSGVNHSQAIPFAHRLGATGALTFTISVELAGRSEADWRGRVVCTTLGWDNQGSPLQASFGATLTP